jgi:hypothetical protein
VLLQEQKLSGVKEKRYVTVWRTSLSNPYSSHVEIMSRINCRMAGTESFLFQFTIENMKLKIQRTIILPILSCCGETWSLTLRMEQRLRFNENRMLRKIFGLERDEINRERRRL